MNEQASQLFRICMNRFPLLPADSLLGFLPEEEAQAIKSQQVLGNDPEAFVRQPEILLEKIHYSWLLPEIDRMPSSLQEAVIQALPENSKRHLLAQMKRPPAAPPPAACLHVILQRKLGMQMQLGSVLPLSFLPDTPLKALATLTKGELVQAIDLLSMYDLAEEIRHVVDKKKLQNVYQMLTPQKAQYLKRCLQQRERLVIPKLDIDKYGKETKKLEAALHQRGILRMGRALSGQHPDLLWHVMHILDIGRGSILQKCFQAEPIAGATPVLLEQLVNVLNFLKIEKTT